MGPLEGTLPGGSRRWASGDMLSTVAVVLILIGITGYVTTSPMALGEDNLDELFAEVWDDRTETQVATSSMLELVQSAYVDLQSGPAGRLTPTTPPPLSTPSTSSQTDKPGAGAGTGPSRATGNAPKPGSTPPVAPVVAVPSPPPFTVPGIGAGVVSGSPQPQVQTVTNRRSTGNSVPPSDAAPLPVPNPERPILSTVVPRPRPPGQIPGQPPAPAPAPPIDVPAPVDLILVPPAPIEPPPPPILPPPAPVLPPDQPRPEPTETSVPAATATSVPTRTPVVTAVPTETPAGITTPTPVLTPTGTPTTGQTPTHTPTPGLTPTSAPTSTPTPPHTPTSTPTPVSGYVVIRTDAPASGFMVMANIRPGSCAVQQITVTNVGLLPFTSYSLTTSPASAATMLWTDPANGLQLRIRRGSTVIYDGPLAVTGLSVGGQLQPGEPDLLEFGVCLPALAGNSAQGQTQTVTLTWTAIGG